MLLDLLTRGIVGIASATFLKHINRMTLKTSTVNKLFCVYIFAVTFNFDANSRVIVTHHGNRNHCSSMKPMVVRNIVFVLLVTLLLFDFAGTFKNGVVQVLISSRSVCSTAVRFLS